MMPYMIRSGCWDELQQDAQFIREQVFIQEQQIAVEDEWDSEDFTSQHFVVYDQDNPIATARLLTHNSIGRVAVLKSYRGLGVGRLLMLAIIEQAQQQQRVFLKLSAQVHAIAFYESLGFVIEGQHYLDCDIPHVDMRRLLK